MEPKKDKKEKKEKLISLVDKSQEELVEEDFVGPDFEEEYQNLKSKAVEEELGVDKKRANIHKEVKSGWGDWASPGPIAPTHSLGAPSRKDVRKGKTGIKVNKAAGSGNDAVSKFSKTAAKKRKMINDNGHDKTTKYHFRTSNKHSHPDSGSGSGCDENIDPTKSYFKTIKTSLKSVVKEEFVIDELINTARLTSRIMTHTLQFMKLYLIDCHDKEQPLPKIDGPFVTAVMKTICVETTNTGAPPSDSTEPLMDLLKTFHTQHYSPIIKDTPGSLSYTHLNTVLDYMSTEVITMYENNIKQQFCSYVERFVNVSQEKKERIEDIKESDYTAEEKKAMKNTLCRELRKVKNDILSVNDAKTSDRQYHDWIDKHNKIIIPQRQLSENSVYYDIQKSPGLFTSEGIT